jgi:hypothetical protein
MKIIKNLTLLSFIFLISCTKIIDTSQKVHEELNVVENLRNNARNIVGTNTSDTSYANYVLLRLSQLANSSERDSSYDIDAFARFSNSGDNIDVGPIGIGDNITMLPDSNNLYHYKFPLNEGIALFGTTIPIAATEPLPPENLGGLASRVRVIMAVPTQIYPLSVNFPANVIDRTTVLPVTWSPDPNNQYGKVQIDVSYYSGLSQHNAIGMPNSVASLSYQVADNGSFTIPAADLNRFPRDAFIGISIARVWSTRSVNNVSYVAYVEGRTVPLLVVSSGPLVVDFATSPANAFSTRMTPIINGGIPPFTYEWRKKDYYNSSTWSNILSTSNTYDYSGDCIPGQNTISAYFRLTVKDNLGNSASVEKRVSHNCPRH